MATLKNTNINDTGFLKLPVGTTAERPASPLTGYVRVNSSTGFAEIFNGSTWVNLTAPPSISVNYLVIAGGGGGGNNAGCGGGAGGYRSSVSGENSGGGAAAESPLNITSGTPIQVTIGAGGVGASIPNGSGRSNGGDGGVSVFSAVSSVGGGGGSSSGSGPTTFTGRPGGSGGGGAAWNGGGGGTGGGGSGTLNQGFKGGDGINAGAVWRNGGGGGAGGVGQQSPSSNVGGLGGAGVASFISGVSVTRASGGSSYDQVGSTPGGGGAFNISGQVNTGGGAGGETANGGSGIVIISYLDTNDNIIIPAGLFYKNSSGVKTQGTGIRVAPTLTSGGKKIYEFLEGSGNIQF